MRPMLFVAAIVAAVVMLRGGPDAPSVDAAQIQADGAALAAYVAIEPGVPTPQPTPPKPDGDVQAKPAMSMATIDDAVFVTAAYSPQVCTPGSPCAASESPGGAAHRHSVANHAGPIRRLLAAQPIRRTLRAVAGRLFRCRRC